MVFLRTAKLCHLTQNISKYIKNSSYKHSIGLCTHINRINKLLPWDLVTFLNVLRSIQDLIVSGELSSVPNLSLRNTRASDSSEHCVLFFCSERVVTRINHPHVL